MLIDFLSYLVDAQSKLPEHGTDSWKIPSWCQVVFVNHQREDTAYSSWWRCTVLQNIGQDAAWSHSVSSWQVDTLFINFLQDFTSHDTMLKLLRPHQ